MSECYKTNACQDEERERVEVSSECMQLLEWEEALVTSNDTEGHLVKRRV